MLTIHTGPIMLHPKGFKTSLENITPERAAEYLLANTKNVPTSESKVSNYVSDLEAGRWADVPGSIVFCKDGILMNGQHRLLAIVKSGITLPMYEVKSGYSFDDIAAIDPDKPAWTHAERRGARHSKASCSGAKIALNWFAGRVLHGPVSKPFISDYVVKNAWLQDVAGYAARANFKNPLDPKKRITIPAGPLAAALFVSTFDGVGRERVADFIAGLRADSSEWKPGDPRHELARFMLKVHQERSRTQASDTDIFNACAQAWGYHLEGSVCTHILFQTKATKGVEVVNAIRDAARKVAVTTPLALVS